MPIDRLNGIAMLEDDIQSQAVRLSRLNNCPSGCGKDILPLCSCDIDTGVIVEFIGYRMGFDSQIQRRSNLRSARKGSVWGMRPAIRL